MEKKKISTKTFKNFPSKILYQNEAFQKSPHKNQHPFKESLKTNNFCKTKK